MTTSVDTEAVAEAVASCPTVARLTSGLGVEVATYLVDRRVKGVRVGADGTIEVHVAAHYGVSLPDLAAEVRRAVTGVTGPARVDVSIDELNSPGDEDFTGPAPELPATTS